MADTKKNVLYRGMIENKINTKKSCSCEEVKIKRQETKDVTVHIISLPFDHDRWLATGPSLK